MENVFIKWPQRSWVLLGSCLSFRCRTQNVLRRLGRLLLCTSPIILSFLPSTQPRNVGFCAAHGTAHWLLPPAMSWSVLPLPALRTWQIPAALTRPVLGACLEHQSEASGCQTLLSKWNKSHFGSSWLLERYTQCPVSGSTCGGVLALEGYFNVSTDRNSCV